MLNTLESTLNYATEQARRAEEGLEDLVRRLERIEGLSSSRGDQGQGFELTTPRASSPTDFSPPSAGAIRRYKEATPKVSSPIRVQGQRFLFR